MTSNLIYIGDLDKVRLLEVLCKNMPRGRTLYSGQKINWISAHETEAISAVKYPIGDFMDHNINSDLSGDYADPTGYDNVDVAIYGYGYGRPRTGPRPGAFQTVVTQLRERGDAFKKPPPPPPSFIKRVLSFLRF